MNTQKSKLLLEKYLKGQCSPQEEAIVESWYFEISGKQKDNLGEPDYAGMKQEIFNAIILGEQQRPVKVKSLWPRIAAAASILLFLTAGIYYFSHKHISQESTNIVVNDIVPGGNKAILTLANGKEIVLNSAKNGRLTLQGQMLVNKIADGQIVYNILKNDKIVSKGAITGSEYNTISTPKGGQYALTLSDGTKVILNAASTLTYPVSFNGNERRVKLNGEAYFEVTHNKEMPFHVNSLGQDIQVLGTHFNVNSYADEPITKTTLLQGSVKINNNEILKPGEQSSLNKVGTITIRPVETDEVVAWKNGKFVFESEKIESIMRKLSRWYNVEVVYEGRVNDASFTGSVSKFDNISKILNKISFTSDIHFKIEGRRITVTK